MRAHSTIAHVALTFPARVRPHDPSCQVYDMRAHTHTHTHTLHALALAGQRLLPLSQPHTFLASVYVATAHATHTQQKAAAAAPYYCCCSTLHVSVVHGRVRVRMSGALRIALVCAVVAAAVLAVPGAAQAVQRSFSLHKPYIGAGLDIPYWDFGGSTVVADDYVRLTPDRQSKQGYLWAKLPNHMAAWELTIDFKVWGQGKRLFGDGWAFWYTKDRTELGPVFGSKDYFTGLGVFFDTYSNHNGHHNHGHPYISAMVNDGSLHYDHDADGTLTELAGCESQFRNVDHPTRVRIMYIDRTVQVFLDTNNRNEWRQCFVVGGVDIPTGYYFGFSAATGQVADNHDIISIKAVELPTHQPAQEVKAPHAEFHAPLRERVDDQAPSAIGDAIGSILTIVLYCTVAVAVLGVGVVFVRMKLRERANKRFY